MTGWRGASARTPGMRHPGGMVRSAVRWRRVGAGSGLALLLAVGGAGPAMAAAPRITVTGPTADQQLSSSSVAVSARIEMSNGVLTDRARLSVQQVGSNRAPATASAAISGSSQTVTFPAVALPYNGTYRATISASGSDRPLDLNGEESATAERTFAVAAPPASPAEVRTAVDAATRAVTVTWKANTEPDLLFYVVQRSKGGGDFAILGKATQPSFVDATTADAGGDYRYQVVAVRNGVRDGEGISSDPSALGDEATAKVPDPPAPPTSAPGTTVAGGAGATPPGSAVPAGSPGALATSGRVDLTGFNNVQSQAARRATPPRTVVPPDTGFQSTLPFDQPVDTGEEEAEVPEGGDLGELAADSPEFRELGAEDEGEGRQRSLALFAGGLLATVLLMHVLWVKSEVKRLPLEAVAPEGPPPGAAGDGTGKGGRKAAAKPAKAKRAAAPPDWFVPDLGVDDGADRVPVTAGPGRKAS